MTTIADIARETNAQPYEIAALLDLGTDYTDATELTDEEAQLCRDETQRIADEQA